MNKTTTPPTFEQIATLANVPRHTWASIAESMIGKTRDESGTVYVQLVDAEAYVRGLLDAMTGAPAGMIPVTAGLPPFDQGERVLVYTEGVDFAREQYFDIPADDLWALKENQSEIAAHATHWALLPLGLAENDRKTVLLRAAHALLKKQAFAGHVINLLSETVHYDGTDCDGLCLISDIEDELGIDGEARPA